MRTRAVRVGIIALALCIVAASAQAQDSLAIHGKVVDQNGRPVVSVQVTLAPGLRRATSLDEGTFEIHGLRMGTYTLSARRIGYQAGSVSVFVRDSVTSVTVTLMAIPRELDSVRIREKESGLRYSAMVLDQNDQPVRDAEVVAVGVRGTMTTDSLGRFSVPGLDRGTLIVQIRKIGYARYFNSLRMLAERADTIYMARLPQTLTPIQVNEISGFGSDYWAQRDLQQRQSWKNAMGGAVSREELAQHGKEDLCDALPGTASGVKLSLHNDPYCKSFPRGTRTILVDGVRCVHTLLSDFAADEVELVEVIPAGTSLSNPRRRRGGGSAADLSGSLAAKNCDTPAPVYVIWTRRSPDFIGLIARADSGPPPDTTRSIAGTAFDSIAQRPLAGAHVHVADLNRDTVTDSLGVFRFDSVGSGVHGVWLDHPALDALGLYSLGERVDATPMGVSRVALAIPSFATLWGLACSSAPPANEDRGFVFGRVHAGDSAVTGASAAVDMQWRATAADSSSPAGTRMQRSIHPDSTGNYALCGVPVGRVVTLSVHDSAASALPVSFKIGATGIARRDLALPSGAAFERLLADSSATPPPTGDGDAVLVGFVRDSTGQALRDVRVSISGVGGEWRTDSSGKLTAHGISAGEHVVTVTAVGFERERRLAQVAPGDSASLAVSMSRLMTRLNTVTIEERRRLNAVRADIDHRKKLGFGYRVDSVGLSRLPGVGEAFVLPSVHVKFNGNQWSLYMTRAGAFSIPGKGGAGLKMDCAPTIWIDGFKADVALANSLTKDEIGLIETYTSAAGAPLEYTGSNTNCGIVLIWRKRYISP